MITARWIQSSGDPNRPANVRDEQFAFKADFLKKVAQSNISNIVKVPTAGGKLYAVTLKKQ